MTRYFMTIPEAVQLVLRASTLAAGGEISVPDMGEPVRIAEMARDLVRLSGLEPGRDIEVVDTGLRPGEKPAEELWSCTEDLEATAQDKLLVIRRPEAEAASLPRLLGQMESLERLAKAGGVEHIIPALRRVVPEYEPMPVDAARTGHAAPMFVRSAAATNGAGPALPRGTLGAPSINGDAPRRPDRAGKDLPARGSPPAGEARPTAP